MVVTTPCVEPVMMMMMGDDDMKDAIMTHLRKFKRSLPDVGIKVLFCPRCLAAGGMLVWYYYSSVRGDLARP